VKLWQKVSLLCVCVLLAVVIVCSSLLLFYARDNILSNNIEQAKSRQSSLVISFTEMAQYYLRDGENPFVKSYALKYYFQRFADETSVLIRDGEILQSSIIFDPAEILPLAPDDDAQYVLTETYDRNILIVGSPVLLLGEVYSVYTVKDITVAYNDIARLTWRFAAVCAASIIVGTILIIILVRKASQPLISLKRITRRIAVGEYDQRADIRTNDEVGALASDFNDMAEAVQSRVAQLEDTAQRQKLFIGGLTHELKTPMASMIIHTETLLTADLNSDEARNSLIHLNEQSRWMERLSQKLLRLITLELEIKVQPENIQELIDDVSSSTAELMRERETPLIAECEITAMKIDYDLMKSLLINLIDNASKASKPGQEVTLRAYENTIEVSDHGSGIPPEDTARVTDAFYTVDRSRSKEIGGSGLGLALVKRIDDAHGAELVIESEPTASTTVKVVFPESNT